MATTTLTCNTRDSNSGGFSFAMTPRKPLWIKELILIPHPTVPPYVGSVPPGNQGNPRSRTVYVTMDHPTLTAPLPFAVSLTYDANFSVTNVGNPVQLVAPLLPFTRIAEDLAELNDEEQAEFLARVHALFDSLPDSPELQSNLGEGKGPGKPAKNGKDHARAS